MVLDTEEVILVQVCVTPLVLLWTVIVVLLFIQQWNC